METDKKLTAAQLAATLAGGDPSMEQELAEHRRATQLVSTLENLRVRKGLRQKDVAEKMGVSDSSISRIEASRDADLRYGELTEYANALGLTMTLLLEDPSLPVAEQIKHCVFLISDLLKKLTALAKECQDDPVIFEGIARFQGEVLYNFLLQHAKSSLASPVRIDYSRANAASQMAIPSAGTMPQPQA